MEAVERKLLEEPTAAREAFGRLTSAAAAEQIRHTSHANM